MPRNIRLDAVLVQAVIAGALSFAHLHDLAEAAGQDGWKAWAYPISVDLLLVAAWRRMRTHSDNRAAWVWFVIALAASLGANIATAGLLDLEEVPAWLRILVAGWPALAFLGGTLLAHAPITTEPADPDTAPLAAPESEEAPDVRVERAPDPAPELPPAPASVPKPAPVSAPTVAVPPALLDHAQKVADTH
ncbi:SpdA protein, partial [Streptomyces sp. FT05W]